MNVLELQKEILAADGDEEQLAKIAERHGIDPALWAYSSALFKMINQDSVAAPGDHSPSPVPPVN